MIEQLYLDLTEETNDKKIYGKLFQACKSAAEELFQAANSVNELHQEEMTPFKRFAVPEVLDVQVVPSEEVRIFPESPTVTNVPFP